MQHAWRFAQLRTRNRHSGVRRIDVGNALPSVRFARIKLVDGARDDVYVGRAVFPLLLALRDAKFEWHPAAKGQANGAFKRQSRRRRCDGFRPLGPFCRSQTVSLHSRG